MKKLVCLFLITFILAWAGAASPDLTPIKKAMVANLAIMSSLLAAINAEDFDAASAHARALGASAARGEERNTGRPQASFYLSLKLATQRMELSLKDKNVPEFVAAYGSALGACMGCHTTLRKE